MAVGPGSIPYLEASAHPDVGAELLGAIESLYPICRSITGDGVRETLNILKRSVPIELREIPTGTPAFDWTVPREWNIRDAYIKDASGNRVVDFRSLNLHVVNYSIPVKCRLSLQELRPHLHTLPERPDWVPYRTAYYRDDWGFCLTHRQLMAMPEGEYEVCIDSSLQDGHLSYGEILIKGETDDVVLLSAHICHPSLCNDNLSGITLATKIAQTLLPLNLRYSYRFIFAPATIGSIVWLSQNEAIVKHIKHGLVLACLGDAGKSTYKQSRRGNAEIDRAAAVVLRDSKQDHRVDAFLPYGYDERQYCSPGFDLPVGSLMRTPNGRFPEYHTSGDNIAFMDVGSLTDSFVKVLSLIHVLEYNRTYINLNPKCEPQLGRRGVYRALSDRKADGERELALLWVLNQSDGRHSLLDIAERSGISFGALRDAAEVLMDTGLLAEQSRGLDQNAG